MDVVYSKLRILQRLRVPKSQTDSATNPVFGLPGEQDL